MTPDRAFWLIVGVLVVGVLIVAWRCTRPKDAPMPQPSWCVLCGRRYLAQQGLVWHAQMMHPRNEIE